MNPLRHPDDLHLRAAVGWLELGDHREALRELLKIRPSFHRHPDVQEVRWQVFARDKDWRRCFDIAHALIQAVPGRPSGWIHLSYSLHELGQTADAYENLKRVVRNFPEEVVMRYNLACYCCRLSRREEALRWLKKALRLGDRRKIMLMALEDPDLADLTEEVRRMKRK